ncbi:MAG: zinc ABC transporter substrate-binding protein [Elusimicrobiaceae bacterium]|nr:zinc ABC transporter substrate-binding protein [Elusimicrobiaceae bacterium]
MKKKYLWIPKKFWAVLIVAALVIFGAWWFMSDKQSDVTAMHNTRDKMQVTASSYVVYDLARQIGGDQVALSLLVPPGTEPHHFEPTPGSIIGVQKADLLVYVSTTAEPWITDILQGAPGVRAVAAAAVEPGEDPHVWMTPYGALSMAKQIAAALQKADPVHKNYYQQNVKQFERTMSQLHKDFVAGLANCQHREIVHVGHLAFGALANTYGLQLQTLAGTSHQGEHSVYKLTNMVRFIRKSRVPAIFTEEMLSPELADTIAQETHVYILPLYTIEEVSKTDFEQGTSYQDFMRRNLANLQKGLKCQA